MADPVWTDPEIWTSNTAAALAAGGAVVVMGLWIALMRRRANRQRTTRTGRQAKVMKQFQGSAPLREALDRLADRSNPEARVAAVESLKQMARESPRDYWSVMEILTTHLRRYARAPGAATKSVSSWVTAERLPNGR